MAFTGEELPLLEVSRGEQMFSDEKRQVLKDLRGRF